MKKLVNLVYFELDSVWEYMLLFIAVFAGVAISFTNIDSSITVMEKYMLVEVHALLSRSNTLAILLISYVFSRSLGSTIGGGFIKTLLAFPVKRRDVILVKYFTNVLLIWLSLSIPIAIYINYFYSCLLYTSSSPRDRG